MSKNGVLKCMQISSLYVSLTTPFAAGICSARVDGARVGSAASVRITLISCRAGTDLCEKLTPDFNPMLTSYLSHRSIASWPTVSIGAAGRGETGVRRAWGSSWDLGPGTAWALGWSSGCVCTDSVGATLYGVTARSMVKSSLAPLNVFFKGWAAS